MNSAVAWVILRIDSRFTRSSNPWMSSDSGLIVTELVINSLKHAFVDGRPGGEIIVAFAKVGTNWKLSVSDDGVGQPIGHKVTAGLGTSIVQALAKQLDAEVESSMAPGGTTVSITHGSFGSQVPKAA